MMIVSPAEKPQASFSIAKAAVCRYQLGTALRLFMDDKDPVSVHVLACAAVEILEGMAILANADTVSTTVLKNYDLKDIKTARHRYYNAFKHFTDRKNKEREDDELIANFSDEMNDHLLWQGWEDLLVFGTPIPIAAQVFIIWHLANHIDVVSSDSLRSHVTGMFPFKADTPRSERKRMLRRKIEKYKKDKKIMNDPNTCQHPLSVNNWTGPIDPLAD